MNVFSSPQSGRVTAGTFTPNGKALCTGAEDGTFTMWDPKSAATQFKLGPEDQRWHQGAINAVACHPDSVIAITGATDNSAKLVHLGNEKVLASFQDHADSVEDVAFSPVLGFAATASLDGKICVYDPKTLRKRFECAHDAGVTRIAWQAEGPMLYSCGLDYTVRVWDGRSGQCARVLEDHRENVLDLAVSADGRTLVSCSDDHLACVFRLD